MNENKREYATDTPNNYSFDTVKEEVYEFHFGNVWKSTEEIKRTNSHVAKPRVIITAEEEAEELKKDKDSKALVTIPPSPPGWNSLLLVIDDVWAPLPKFELNRENGRFCPPNLFIRNSSVAPPLPLTRSESMYWMGLNKTACICERCAKTFFIDLNLEPIRLTCGNCNPEEVKLWKEIREKLKFVIVPK